MHHFKAKSTHRPTYFVNAASSSSTTTGDHANVGPEEDSQDSLGLYTVTSKDWNLFNVTVKTEGKSLEVDVDTDASMSIIQEEVYQKHFRHIQLQSTA